MALTDKLSAIANAIRAKTGKTNTPTLDQMPTEIAGIQTGITPSGSLTITENGTFDVTNYASVLANIQGLNARVYNVTLDSDQTGITYLVKDDWILSIRENSNAFVMMRYLGTSASTAAVHMSFTANFVIYYSGSTAYKSMVLRSTTSSITLYSEARNLSTEAYNGSLNIAASGQLYCYGNASFPLKAGNYQIIAGLIESL